PVDEDLSGIWMRGMIEETELIAAGKGRLHVLQSVHRHERQTFVAQPLQSTLFGAEHDRIGAAGQPIGQLTAVPGGHGTLVAEHAPDELFAELDIKLRRLVAARSRYRRI